MDYFEILNLRKEPFSNSPDPDFFFQSKQHKDCLQKLEISVRLRRGLNVVVGEVGTGKTTLCRQLIRRFSADETIETHLLLDPQFPSSNAFLTALDRMLHEKSPDAAPGPETEFSVKERIKQYLFQKGVDEGKTLVLIIDEGQKIATSCLEILRELLNYETNNYKLLQIIIFAQKEFEPLIAGHENFTDRINLYHRLGPLDFRDTWRMIAFRLQQSSRDRAIRPVFTLSAFLAIYISTGGFPRKIINLCHQSILTMIVQNRTKAGWFLIRSCAGRTIIGKKESRRMPVAAAAGLLLVMAILLLGYSDGLHFWKVDALEKSYKPPNATPADVPASKTNPAAVVSSTLETVPEDTGRTAQASLPEEPRAPEADTGKAEPQMPGSLGQVAIRKGESLGRIALSVYGKFDSGTMKQLIAANPHISNPDNIGTGTVINLPAIPVAVKPSGTPCWWVRLGAKDSLEEAMALIRSYMDDPLPIRMIPYYSKAGGLKFEILAKEYFFDPESARKHLQEIPAASFPHAGIRSGWEDINILFANPYLVYKIGGRPDAG